MMRVGQIKGKRTFELAELPEPELREGGAVVEISRCGICGSDVHAYVEGWPYAPAICGHEWVGTVAAVATGVTTVAEGDVVTGGVRPGCGTCEECRAGLAEYCAVGQATYAGRESGPTGGFAPMIGVDAARLNIVAPGLDADRAALIEPASVALHAVRRSRLRTGDLTCVVGCGPIGLLTLQCAKIAGAGHLVAVEPDARRRELALAVGADAAFAPGAELRDHIDERSRGLRADIAYDCAGIPQTLQQSVDMVRRGGSVCMVGVSGGEATIVPMRWMMKEVSVDTSLVFTLEEMAIATDFIATQRLAVSELIEGTVTLDQLGSTIDDLAEKRSDAIKILVDPTAG
jgi:(R,R)-butanediol dehydrogenase/meso-butanediol dehydrogenase/diacetyl reductase